MLGRLGSVGFWPAHVDALERHLDRMGSVSTNEKEGKEK